MIEKKEKTYIAIDLKSFYASVECVERGLDPLETNLVVADSTRTDKTICLAVTPSLKAYGLSGRSRLFEVVQKAKEVKALTGKKLEYIVAPPRMGLYIDYSAKIYSIYMKYISPDDIHVYSIDEVFMDVTEYMNLYGISPEKLTERIIKDVYEQTGITATAGVATNLYLCKVAMDIVAKHKKPDKFGVRIACLDEMTYRKTLWNHKPLNDFWRVGKGTVKRLGKLGITTMGELARYSLYNENRLYKVFGIDAEILIDHAWGYEPCSIADIKAYKPRTESLSSGQVLQEPYDFEHARIVVSEMIELLVLDMVKKGMKTDSVTMDINYDRENVDSGDFDGEVVLDYYGRTVPKSAHGTANQGTHTSSTENIKKSVLELYDRIVDKNLTIRKINLSANNLKADAFTQLNLFEDFEREKKENDLQNCMIELKKKFGKNAILKGIDLCEGATTIMRNNQIGGHKA